MDTTRERRAAELFNAAVELPTGERTAFVQRECGQDAELRSALEGLLIHDRTATATLPAGALDTKQTMTARATGVVAPGRVQIEGFEILGEISHGGQGVVYEAIQIAAKRKVALKILLHGRYASAAEKRRFEREVELIAQLDHPNIVTVFDAGMTADAQPYYAMDYIRGCTLRTYVRGNRLPLEDVLKLFGKVCAAVQHAHQNGVIHRDLKPSNILVTDAGEPKVLDFGLARPVLPLTDEHLTLSRDIMGTLPYMSPEQSAGGPGVDARTDVYSLGVILYELLTGHYPYPVVGQLAEVLRNIAEVAPASPTSRWSRESGVARRSVRHRATGRCPIDHDIQTIVLRALAKESARRYQSAGELQREIERYLVGEPIEAKRDSPWYVLRKLARRHAIATATAASVLAILVGMSSIAAYFYGERTQAVEQQEAAEILLAAQDLGFDELQARVVRELQLGWFLHEWHSGHAERARQILRRSAEGSAERAAMGFLLDEDRESEAFLARLPESERALGGFVVGEREYLSGNFGAARRWFEESLQRRPKGWVAESARARIEAIDRNKLRGESGQRHDERN